MDHIDLINRTFRSWLVYQSNNYTRRNNLPGESIIYDPTVSESEIERSQMASGQYYSYRAVEHSSMLQFFQPEGYRIVTDVMLRSYRKYFRRELEPRHFFVEETMDPLSSMLGLTAS